MPRNARHSLILTIAVLSIFTNFAQSQQKVYTVAGVVLDRAGDILYWDLSSYRVRAVLYVSREMGCPVHAGVAWAGTSLKSFYDAAFFAFPFAFAIRSTCARWFRSCPANMRTICASVSFPRS